MTTFGFEAEFQSNASAVIAALHERGLAGDRVLHSYHCDCDSCAFENGHLFRGQTDSSCSGEIISDVLEVSDASVDAMVWLAEAAVDVDAEPGNHSGFHVHVGIGDFYDMDDGGSQAMNDALWQLLRWEPVLQRIAGGRWAEQRDGMNTTLREANSYAMQNRGIRNNTAAILAFEDTWREEEPERITQVKRDLHASHRGNDRHSNLNIAARNHPTWEFRLWNSTRSAWRMELFCRLSIALLDPQVIAGLGELRPPTRLALPNTGITDVALACHNAGHGRVADLLERQSTYLLNRAGEASPTLTVI